METLILFLIPFLIAVESNGRADAVGDNGKAYGILQIWEPVVVDVNRVYRTKYTHRDAFDPRKAREICRLYLLHYGKALERREGRKATLQDLARIWNGGPKGYQKGATQNYWNKVKSRIDRAGGVP